MSIIPMAILLKPHMLSRLNVLGNISFLLEKIVDFFHKILAIHSSTLTISCIR